MRKNAYLQRLQFDLKRWVGAGWVSDELSERLLADAAQHDYKSDRSSPILPALAALIITFGLLTIIAANWSDLNGVARLILFFALFGATTFGAGELRARGLNLGSNLSAAIAAALAGGGLVVVGQLYHTSATTTDFLSVWTILAAILAGLLRAPLAAAVAGLLMIAWTSFHLTNADYWNSGAPDKLFYGPFWAIPVWGVVVWRAIASRSLGLVHLAFIGAFVWITPTVHEVFGGKNVGNTGSLLLSAAFWAVIAAGAEAIARSSGVWSSRTIAGWSAWTATAYLSFAALSDRFQTKFFGDFGLAILALAAFSALTAYGAAPGRRWLRGAGVAGFIAVSAIFFTLADDLLTSGIVMIAFGVALIGLLTVTNRMLQQARQSEAGGAAS